MRSTLAILGNHARRQPADLLVMLVLVLGTGMALADLPATARLLALAAVALALLLGCQAIIRVFHEQRDLARGARQEAEALREQARIDPVTGLANRIGFDLALAQLAQNLAPGEKLVLMWMDLRGFKQTNDLLGHRTGDEVLQTMAKRIRQEAPPQAALARFAADEFLIAARVDSRSQAELLATAIADAAAQPMRIAGHRIAGGAWLGAALMPDDAAGPGTLAEAADLALYHAKSTRRNAVRFFAEAMTRDMVRRKEIEADLRTALQRDDLTIAFQPIIDLETGRIRAFEALVRWIHPAKGEIQPDDFIPVAEETGLIIALGNWITAEAARIANGWPGDVGLAVNLSPVQIKAPGAAAGILAALAEARLDPARLELEVTEALFVEDDPGTAAFMHELAQHGVRFALDDFGTGHSSLRHIHHYPFSTLKLDRSLISGASSGPRSDAVIRAVAEMGQTLGMEIVAEGLETIDQVLGAKAAGCTLGQGWHFSRAVPDYTAAMMLAEEAERRGAAVSPAPARKAG
jgi:diguanylate cyclase (GGDEF)-like protein